MPRGCCYDITWHTEWHKPKISSFKNDDKPSSLVPWKFCFVHKALFTKRNDLVPWKFCFVHELFTKRNDIRPDDYKLWGNDRAMNFLRDDNDVDAMALSVGECTSVAAGHYTPQTEGGEPHIPAVMLCYQGIIQHNEWRRPLWQAFPVVQRKLCFVHELFTERNDLRPDHCKLWGNYTRGKEGGGGEFICITRGVSHCGLAIYIIKYLKAKEELWKLLNYFTMQKYNLQKIL